ncbi:C type lectin isoform 1 [Schistosoma japonicum]|uniref:C type lectin isoform 1 n=1 Tax=Schistosoma japonicum TaxID=6182 RepID=A0A4Z2DL65_SCHJA|nr:C type lectin isoform 1 [Schistosoma japonicum]TNN16901.1 C type lectin isoform 1 [Schistosoma japonicum]
MSEFGTNDEHIEGNIEILDYLQGISGLERDFSKLAERVINAAVTLSDRDNVAHPERIYDKETGVSVDRCWTYISQLSEAIQFHITKSHEYHKFHHEIWAARMEIQQLLSSYSLIQEKLGSLSLLTDEALATVKSMIESQLSIYTKLSFKSKEFLAKSCILKSVFLRNALTHGKHSAYLLASLRLPSGQWVHRGDSVKVWGSNQFESKLHNEWNAEVSNGEQLNAPSICFWLTSPEHSPISDKRNRIKSSDIEENYENLGKFSSTKNVCKRFHKDLFSSWKIAVNLFANILMPTCKNYVKSLANIEQPIIVENLQEFNTFLNKLQTILEYENEAELETLKTLSHRSHEAKVDSIIHVQSENIQQLTETLKTWEILLQKLKEMKMKAFENEANDQSLEESKNDDLYYTFTPSLLKATNKQESMSRSELNNRNNEKQLITCFTDITPKTFHLNKPATLYDHRIRESPCIKDSVRYQIDHTSQNFSQSIKQTKELMTQIDSPLYSAVAYCTNCSEFHEINLMSPIICKAEASTSNINSSSEISDTSEVRLKTAHSMPSLSIETKDSSVVEDKALAYKNKKCRALKKLSKSRGRKQHRQYTLIGSCNETTASSGFDSPSESSVTTKDKTNIHQIYGKASPEIRRNESGKRPFLWWYKRGKRAVKDDPNDPVSPNTEPGPPGRRSPLNIAPSESVKNQDQLIESTGSTVRSYSWIQQGTPRGYTPPSDSKWWPSTHILPTTYHEKNKSLDAHSERSKIKNRKPLRKYSFENDINQYEQSENQMYNTIDSGIQTDIDMYISKQLDSVLLEVESNNRQNSKNPEYICQHCSKSTYKVYRNDNSVQCNFIDGDVLIDKLHHPSHLFSSHIDEKPNKSIHRRSKSSGIRIWDVCCQIGTVKRNQGTEPINSEDIHLLISSIYRNGKEYNEDSRMYAKHNERSKSFETPSRRLSQLTIASNTKTLSPLKYSVSCQIGTCPTPNSIVTDPATDSCKESKEYRKVCNNQICDASSYTTCLPVMIGKKFQVNIPSEVQTKDVSMQIQTMENHSVLNDSSNVKRAIKTCLTESESSFITSNVLKKIEHNKVMSNNATKATDCFGLILSNETSTQIGLNKRIELASSFNYNRKDNSVQTDSPHIYVTEANIVPNWTSALNESYKQRSTTPDMPQTQKSLGESSFHIETSTQHRNKLSNHQTRIKNVTPNTLTKCIQVKPTPKSIQTGRRKSLNNVTTISKVERLHKNQLEPLIKREHSNRRAISTCGDLIMNIELHSPLCKHSILHNSNNLLTPERVYKYDDLCKQCRLKYYKPLHMNVALKPSHNCIKSRHFVNHKPHHHNKLNFQRSITKRSLSADDLKVINHKTEIIRLNTMKP